MARDELILSYLSELGGPSGKLFRFVSCVRARGSYVRSDPGEKLSVGTFPCPFLDREVFPFPSALQGPIQFQLALSVLLFGLRVLWKVAGSLHRDPIFDM